MKFDATPEMKKKALEMFQCDKDPLSYLIRSQGDVVEVKPADSILKTLFKSKIES